ncbi:anaerobic ribonucleoside-triphosphate reductase, partial [Parabacteroides distasonis]
MMMKFASETTKPFVDDYLLSNDVREAVEKNYLHIHDKDYYPTKSLTCVQHPLDNILEHGFYAGHGSSRPAKRIETASILGCISMETAQNEMHGGQAIPAFDFYLAPYVR